VSSVVAMVSIEIKGYYGDDDDDDVKYFDYTIREVRFCAARK
jgi:hypothetical protein